MKGGYLDLLAEVERLESGVKYPERAVSKVSEPSSDTFDTPPSALAPHAVEASYLAPADRRAWADALCRRVSDDVARRSPAGLGNWPVAWEIVEPPSRRLLDLLASWEANRDPADQRAAEQAADVVCAAWEDAAAQWEAECAAFERFAIQHETDDTPTPARWSEL